MQVQPIFTATCRGAGCHQEFVPPDGPPIPPAAGLDLSEEIAYGAVVDVASTQCSVLKLVDPQHPGDSYLFRKLMMRAGDPDCSATYTGGSMPTSAFLPPQDIETIRQWIAEGALDN